MTVDQKLQVALLEATEELSASWPEALAVLAASPVTTALTNPAAAATISADEVAKISYEDRENLVTQLRSIAALPPGQLDLHLASELAASLSFALGRSVSFSTAGQQLTYTHGAVLAQSFALNALHSSQPPENQMWSVSISPRDLTQSMRQIKENPWYLHQKVLIINPSSMIGVVGQINAVMHEKLNRYQFGASPAIITAGGFWMPANKGRCIVCFLGEALAGGAILTL